MKKTLLFLLLLLTFSISQSVRADDDFTKAMVKAKKNLKTGLNTFSEKDILKARGDFERILQLKKNTWLVNYYMALCDYNVATIAMQAQDNDKVKKYTQSGLELVEKSLLERDNFSDTYVLKMSLEYNRFQYEQDKMQDIIAQVTTADAEAKKNDPTNPRYYLVKGIADFYTPAAFGGGVDKAIPSFEKSVELFGLIKNTDETLPDWGVDLAYGYMAMSMLDGDKMTEAKSYMDKGLAIEPNSGFLSMYVKKQYDEKAK